MYKDNVDMRFRQTWSLLKQLNILSAEDRPKYIRGIMIPHTRKLTHQKLLNYVYGKHLKGEGGKMSCQP